MTVRLPDGLAPVSTLETDVLVVGSGPAGLAAATEIVRRTTARVTVVERDTLPGGMPRWCAHSPFGMREFGRILSGPAYGDRLAERAAKAGVRILTRHTALSVSPGESMIASPDGPVAIKARRILLATGVRETSRAGLLIGGERPSGIVNTGALQYWVHREHRPPPFRHPVLIGSELVTLSAILTLRAAGIRPVAIIEEENDMRVGLPFSLFPSLLGIKVMRATRLVAIEGSPTVERVVIDTPKGREHLACDGVVLTGRFRPESSLARMSGLLIDRGTDGPAVNEIGQTSDPAIHAAGNLLRGVETAGWCHSEGLAVGAAMVRTLDGLPETTGSIAVTAGAGLEWVMPQRLTSGWLESGRLTKTGLQLRLSRPAEGRLVVTADDRRIGDRPVSGSPARRILVPPSLIAKAAGARHISLHLED